VGLNLDTVLTDGNDGLRLAAKIEQSTVSEPLNAQALKDPVLKQNVMECSSLVKLGVPIILGSYDVPGSNRHFEVRVMLERTP
jgi:hypothetical protein